MIFCASERQVSFLPYFLPAVYSQESFLYVLDIARRPRNELKTTCRKVSERKLQKDSSRYLT